MQGYNITLTTTQVQEAIKQGKNNNSQGPDKLNIRHLKHIGLLGLVFLTSKLKNALNTNIIPHIWKLANIIPIPKPNKDIDKDTSYRPISLLSVIAKALEKSSKRHSLQAVELSQWTQAARQIVSNLPSNGGLIYCFLGHAGHADPLDGWRCCSQKRVMSQGVHLAVAHGDWKFWWAIGN